MALPRRVSTNFKHWHFFPHVVGPLAPLPKGLNVPIQLDPTMAIAETRERRQRYERNRTF